MSTISQRIDAVIELALSAPLDAAGFTRRGRTFRRRENDGSLSLIEVQGNKWNHGNTGRFTVNLGRYFPAVALAEEGVARDEPQAHHCHLRQRIGFLMPANTDHWWSLEGPQDDAAAAASLHHAVAGVGLRWLAAQDAATVAWRLTPSEAADHSARPAAPGRLRAALAAFLRRSNR